MDWMAAFCTLMGMYMVGEKRRIGFLITFISSFLWIVYAISIVAWPIVVTNIAFAIVSGRAWIRWNKIKEK